MVSQRSLPLYIILTVVTCGLFSIYWFIVMSNDIAKLREQPEPKGVLNYIIGVLTCGVYTIICYYRYSKYLVEIQQKRGAPVNDISVIATIIGIFIGIVSMALIQNEINKLVPAAH